RGNRYTILFHAEVLPVRIQEEEVVASLEPARHRDGTRHEIEQVTPDRSARRRDQQDLRLTPARIARVQERRDPAAEAADGAGAVHPEPAGVHDAQEALAVHDLAAERPSPEVLDLGRRDQ